MASETASSKKSKGKGKAKVEPEEAAATSAPASDGIEWIKEKDSLSPEIIDALAHEVWPVFAFSIIVLTTVYTESTCLHHRSYERDAGKRHWHCFRLCRNGRQG
jgi:hypothetical protein